MLLKHIWSFNKIILFLTIAAAFFGPSLLVFQFYSIHLFPYRILWLFLLFTTMLVFIYSKNQIIADIESSKLYFIFLSFWFAYALVSIIWAKNKPDAVLQILFLLIGITLIFLVTIYFKNLEDYTIIHFVWVAALLIIVVIGYWNITTVQHLNVSRYAGSSVIKATSVFRNENDLATFIALSLPFLLTLIVYCKTFVIKTVSGIIFIASLVLFLTTGSRVNLLAMLFGFLYWFLFLTNNMLKKKTVITVGLIFIASLLVYYFFPGLLPESILNSLHSGFVKLDRLFGNLLRGEAIGGVSISSRIAFLNNGMIYLVETYGFGIGAGNAEYYIANYQHYETHGYVNLHNWWLEILVNYGVIVFAGFLFYYISMLNNLYRLRNILNDYKALMVCEALLVSLVVFFFASMSSSSLFGFGPMWVLFAFSTGFINTIRNTQNIKEKVF